MTKSEFIAIFQAERSEVHELRQQLAAIEERHQALLKQNILQEQELDEKDAVICGMGKALQSIIHQHPEGYKCRITEIAEEALSSSSPCPHVKEVERLKDLNCMVVRNGETLLRRAEELQAQLDQARAGIKQL